MFETKKLSLLACLIYMGFYGTGGDTMLQHSSEDAIDESSLDAGWVLNGRGRRPCQKKGQLKHMASGKCLMPGGYLPGSKIILGSHYGYSWKITKNKLVYSDTDFEVVKDAFLSNRANDSGQKFGCRSERNAFRYFQIVTMSGNSSKCLGKLEGKTEEIGMIPCSTTSSTWTSSERFPEDFWRFTDMKSECVPKKVDLILMQGAKSLYRLLNGSSNLLSRHLTLTKGLIQLKGDAVPNGKEVMDALITSFQLGTVDSDEKPWNLLRSYKADFTRSIHYNPTLYIALGRGFPQHLVARIIELAAGISRLKIEIQLEGGYPVVDDMLRRKEADGAIELIPLDKNLTLSAGDVEKIDEETNETKLHVQAILGNTDFMRILILHGANIEARDKQQRTPLISAVRRGQPNAAELLLKNKADVSTRDIRGKFPLHYAAEKSGDLVGLLIRYGADVNAVDNAKNTSLHSALMEGSCGLGCVKKLLLSKASVSAKNEKGESPLHLAAKHHTNSIDFLLDHSADLESKDKKNRTPLFSAALQGNTESFKLLLDRGADPKVKDIDGISIENHLGPDGKGEGAKLEINVRSEIMDLIR